MSKQDLRSQPFRTMVALGESHVAGACATDESRRWVNVVAELISRCQGEPVTLHNKGIGANAISPRSPGYASSAKPSALERYTADVIALQPDLFILAYGLNDMRAGMPPEDFREDMAQIIRDVRDACSPVTVLTTVYHMSAYDWYPPYDVGSVAATEVFNLVIRQLAEEHECILADIWDAEGQADWAIHPDTVHANDLGHLLIANRVFEAIATNCSGVAARVTAELAEDRAEVLRTIDQRRRPQDYGSKD
ncbi:MAG: SGNH/GDSL hydrolase family protein [Armatimonadota bacterium]|nr:MAG: SGNH/GDSL hydrolase family protein [Armatimonadota bacterium]